MSAIYGPVLVGAVWVDDEATGTTDVDVYDGCRIWCGQKSSRVEAPIFFLFLFFLTREAKLVEYESNWGGRVGVYDAPRDFFCGIKKISYTKFNFFPPTSQISPSAGLSGIPPR